MRESKYIITKDLKHFKTDTLDHRVLAGLKGYTVNDIIETGLLIDNKVLVLECYILKHRAKILNSNKFIYNEVNDYELILKGRAIYSRYNYQKNIAGLGEGD